MDHLLYIPNGAWRRQFHLARLEVLYDFGSPVISGKKRAAVLYVRVPFEESLRKNQRRFNPDKPDSILEYGLTDSMMERLYRKDDWSILATHDSGSPGIREHNVRCVVFPNEDDVTTGKSYRLAA